MKARWKILIAAGIFLILLIASIMLSAHFKPENEVEAYKKLLRAKGEKLEISEVVPMPVPPESNSLSLLQTAFKMLVINSADYTYTNLPFAMRMAAPGRAIVGWAQPDLRGTISDGYTNSWENALTEVEANRPAVDLLTQTAGFPAVDFQLDYTKGPEILLPHLAPFKRCAQELSAAALCDLHRGNAASATTNLCILLALVQADHEERLLISQLVRIAMASIAASANWELLQSTNLTDAELAALQKSWERQEFIGGMKNAFEFERVSDDATIQKLRASSAEFNRLMGAYAGSFGSGGLSSFSGWGSSGSWFEDAGDFVKDGLDSTRRRSAEYMWRESWSYSDQLHVLQSGQILLEGMRTIETNQIFQPAMKDTIDRLDKLRASIVSVWGSGWLAKFGAAMGGELIEMFSGGMASEGTAIRRVLAAEASRRIVITAIALKRFQLRHGKYPEKLSELTPEFLPDIPLDPADGNPLRYHPNADGTFLLYSIGDDGVDDGGDTTPAKPTTSATWFWQRGRDWVWPQPATDTEIKYFYEHPPK